MVLLGAPDLREGTAGRSRHTRIEAQGRHLAGSVQRPPDSASLPLGVFSAATCWPAASPRVRVLSIRGCPPPSHVMPDRDRTHMPKSGRGSDVRQDRVYQQAPGDLVKPESHQLAVRSAPDPQLLARGHCAS